MACCPYFSVVVVSSLIAVRVSPRGRYSARSGIQRIVPRGAGCALERRRGAGWPSTLRECYSARDVACAKKRLLMPTMPTEDVAGAPAGGKRTIAVVLCAGQGTRLGAGQNKVFLPLAGRPIVVHAVAALTACPEVHGVLLVAHPREVAYCETEIVSRYGLSTVIGVVAGGAPWQSCPAAQTTSRSRHYTTCSAPSSWYPAGRAEPCGGRAASLPRPLRLKSCGASDRSKQVLGAIASA